MYPIALVALIALIRRDRRGALVHRADGDDRRPDLDVALPRRVEPDLGRHARAVCSARHAPTSGSGRGASRRSPSWRCADSSRSSCSTPSRSPLPTNRSNREIQASCASPESCSSSYSPDAAVTTTTQHPLRPSRSLRRRPQPRSTSRRQAPRTRRHRRPPRRPTTADRTPPCHPICPRSSRPRSGRSRSTAAPCRSSTAEIAESDPARGMTAPVVIGEDFDGNTVRIDAADRRTDARRVPRPLVPALQPRGAAHQRAARRGCLPRRTCNIVGVSTGSIPDRRTGHRRSGSRTWTGPTRSRRRRRHATRDVHRRRCLRAHVVPVHDVDRQPTATVLARWSGEHEPERLIELINDNLPQ